ncbi:TetR/AcrR family transcriptional regulator [Nonomuraea insulae]|uniref:TetR/AcrR family transcriptional regulator n=1 Tax=Nonomuraea insulae TaxID=1616787 RepID=A0ABW1DBF4_9ACTN
MPTGVALRDAREQLFDAAERVLLRDGPSGLTSRAVTTEAGCAKGVLHRHFTDFDGFLTELVLDRVTRINAQAIDLGDRAGTGSVADNLTGALVEVFEPVAVAVVGLVISRDELRARLREAVPFGVPILTDAASMITFYLVEERAMGRIAANADAGTLALSLIGAGHLLFADRQAAPPDYAAVHKVVATVIADAVQRRLL